MQTRSLNGPPPAGASTEARPRSVAAALLLIAAAAGAAVAIAWPRGGSAPEGPGLGAVALLVCTAAGAAALIVRAPRTPTWTGNLALAGVLVASALVQADAWLADGRGWALPPSAHLVAGLIVSTSFSLATVTLDFRAHARGGLPEMALDVALVSAVAGAGAFVLLQGHVAPLATPVGLASIVVLAGLAVVSMTAWAILALRAPSLAHLALLCAGTSLGVAALVAARETSGGAVNGLVPVTAGLGTLGMAAVLVSRRSGVGTPAQRLWTRWWTRPVLLVASLLAGGAMLAAPEIRSPDGLAHPENALLIGAVFALVSIRLLHATYRSDRTTSRLVEALGEREEAVSSLILAGEAVAASEARLRLLLESAVDGIVELDGSGRIVRTNDAFCRMIDASPAAIVGRGWREVAEEVPGGVSLAALPETGEATIEAEGGARHLEGSASALPTAPPGTLLLVRDVSVSKRAEQTIRTLLQFLQDRDETRTHLLQRTNAAVDAERNRIARDLHDGPIQGVTAVTLSLEALKLMLARGDSQQALVMLRSIQRELADEVDNLRRVMTDLRPPLLDERGLLPAVREIGARFEREHAIRVRVQGSSHGRADRDVETLAYRIVQEALANVGKHSGAREVAVNVESADGYLELEVVDDGSGFDPEAMPGFLQRGRVGLASMRERAELGGGTLTVWSRPGAGTRIRASLPCNAPSATPLAG